MANYEKFAFAPINDGQISPSPIKRKKVLTDADIAQAREEGFKEGENSAIAIAQKQSAEALRSIARISQLLLGRLHNEVMELNEDAIEFAKACAFKLAGNALEGYEKAATENYIKEALVNLRNNPRITIKVPNHIKPLIENSISQTATEIGFDGKIELRADDNAQIGECSIEWQGGAIRHDQGFIEREINKAAASWLEAKNAHGVQIDLFED